MEISVAELYMLNLVGSFISVAPLFILVFYASQKSYSVKKQASFILISSLSNGFIGSVLTDLTQPVISSSRMVLISCLYLSSLLVLARGYVGNDGLAVVGMASFFSVFYQMIEGVAVVIRFSFLDEWSLVPAHLFAYCFIGVIMSLVVVVVMRFKLFLTKLWLVFQLRKMVVVAIVVDLAYTHLPIHLDVFLREQLGADLMSSRLLIHVYLIVSGIFLYTVVNIFANSLVEAQLLKNQQTRIWQQEIQVKRLEGIQHKMRLLQHDYKNIVASTRYSNNQGVHEVEGYLNRALTSLDDELAASIRQINQLTAIDIMEIKDLVLRRLVEMEAKQIKLNLEVFSTVSTCGIPIADLIDYLDRVLDEAIMTVLPIEKPTVHLVLLQEETRLSVIVKYIAKEGEQFRRGHQKDSLRQYSQVARRRFKEDDYLIQSLTIV